MEIITGKMNTPAKIVLYGTEGVGKSTIAACAPSPIFLDLEGGTAELDVARFPAPSSMDDVRKCFDWLIEHKCEQFKTLVIDTFDWMEKLAAREVCEKSDKDGRKEGIEDFGYGKGYKYLEESEKKILDTLDRLRSIGYNIVVLAHAQVRKFEEPGKDPYDRYELKLEKRGAQMLKEWASDLIFANFYTETVKKDNKVKAVGGSERVLFTTRTAAYDAKNRHGLPSPVAMEWASLEPCFPSEPLRCDDPQISSIIGDFCIDDINGFLISKGMINEGQSIEDLPESGLRRIVNNKNGFTAGVKKFVESK